MGNIKEFLRNYTYADYFHSFRFSRTFWRIKRAVSCCYTESKVRTFPKNLCNNYDALKEKNPNKPFVDSEKKEVLLTFGQLSTGKPHAEPYDNQNIPPFIQYHPSEIKKKKNLSFEFSSLSSSSFFVVLNKTSLWMKVNLKIWDNFMIWKTGS